LVLSWFCVRTVLILAISAVACRQPSLPAREVTLWRPIGSWSGRGVLQTEAFIGETGAFRVRWRTFDETAPGAGTFRVTLHSSVSGRPLLVAVDHRGAGSNTAMVSEDPREFFLVIQAANLDWSVSVDEAVRATSTTSGNR
jgi:hypothetical protein